MTSKEKLESIKKCILNWDEKEIKWFDDIMIKPEREQEFLQKGFYRGRSKNRKNK